MAIQLLQKLRNKHFFRWPVTAIMSVLGMLNMIILYRALPVRVSGCGVFFLSILLLVDTFRSGFLTTAFIKFYAGAGATRKREVVGSAWFIGGAITGILALINIPAFLFSSWIQNPSVVLFVEWFGIIYIASLPYFIASWVVQAEQRFDQLLCILLFCHRVARRNDAVDRPPMPGTLSDRRDARVPRQQPIVDHATPPNKSHGRPALSGKLVPGSNAHGQNHMPTRDPLAVLQADLRSAVIHWFHRRQTGAEMKPKARSVERSQERDTRTSFELPRQRVLRTFDHVDAGAEFR